MSGGNVRTVVPDRPEVKALLAEIKDQPSEPAPRLILADWLEERGDPRGTFLRASCKESPFSDPELDGVSVEKLRQRYEPIWLGDLRDHLRGWAYDLGLLRVGIDPDRLPPGDPDPDAGRPLIGTVRRTFRQLFQLMTGRTDALEQEAFLQFVDTETWAWVETVGFRHLDVHSPAELLASPLMKTIRSVDLSMSNLGDSGMKDLAASSHAARLRQLFLIDCDLGEEGAKAIADSAYLAGLERLYLSRNHLAEEGAAALAHSPHLRRLRHLMLSHGRIGCEGIAALAASPVLAGVKSLILDQTLIGPDGAAALAESPRLDSIELLSVVGNPLGHEGREMLRERFGHRVVGAEEPTFDGGTEIEL